MVIGVRARGRESDIRAATVPALLRARRQANYVIGIRWIAADLAIEPRRAVHVVRLPPRGARVIRAKRPTRSPARMNDRIHGAGPRPADAETNAAEFTCRK